MVQALLSVQNLSKAFGAHLAVNKVSFNVEAGELVGFMGPNGAGKSTTMRLITGFLAPDEGTASIAGHNIRIQRVEALKNVGYLAEQPALYEDLTPEDYLRFMAEAQNVKDVENAIRVAAKLTRCTAYLGQPMGELSKGMRQRVHFAGALIHDPKVLILDEPTDGLDPNQKHELRLVLKELAKTKAIIVSTHILEEAEAICTRLLIMHRGQILTDTTPAELAKQGKGDIQLAFRVLTQNRGKNNDV
ncbi:MAG: multidrug ABC transporter ATP-binding protein [Alphaproteobacteria bacterium CG_4_10_14_0_8_um_filter_53_9]|nr:MAG: multidrug ABC transporter ATP-binding protein [Alphaproteobacteria bacterium CG_4_10_14_0_8_um_filter_53_9]